MRVRTALVLASLGALAGCAGTGRPAMTLDEAKRVADGLAALHAVPPPRSVKDIVAILDEAAPDPERAAGLRDQAEAPPPPGVSGPDLVEFLRARASAASELGWLSRQLAHAREALRLARQHRATLSRALQTAAHAELLAGNIGAALAVYQERYDRFFGTTIFGPEAASLASLRAIVGDLDGAEQLLAEADAQLARARSNSRYSIHGPDLEANIHAARGRLLSGRGRHAEVTREHRDAVARLEAAMALVPYYPEPRPSRVSMQWLHDNLRLRVAKSLQREGRLLDAETQARETLRSILGRSGKNNWGVVHSVNVLADILFEQGRFAEAEILGQAGAKIARDVGSDERSFHLNIGRVQIAGAQAAQGRWAEALAGYDAVDAATRGEPEGSRRALLVSLERTLALYRGGRLDEGLAIARELAARTAAAIGEQSQPAAEARAFVAIGLARKGDRAGALALFRDTVPLLLRASRHAVDGESPAVARRLRLLAVLEAYIELLMELHGSGQSVAGLDPVAEAFRLADAARAGTVQDALSGAAARGAARDSALADLVRREQDVAQQASATVTRLRDLAGVPAGQVDARIAVNLRQHLDRLVAARATLRDEIEQRYPKYASLVDPQPATVEQARSVLAPGEVLLAVFVGEERTVVWAVPAVGSATAAVALSGAREVEALVTTLRRGVEAGDAMTLGQVPPFDVAAAQRLHAALLEPLAPAWGPARHLIVAPHRALARLPFGLLVTAPHELGVDRPGDAIFSRYRAVPFLARRVALSQVPSAASLVALRRAPSPAATRRTFIGFGDPWFNARQAAEGRAEPGGGAAATALVTLRGSQLFWRSAPAAPADTAGLAELPRLPDTADEVRAVGAALQADLAQDVILGARANEQTVRTTDLSDRRVVLFATHGLAPGELDGLTEPALALSSPAVAGVEGDGLLTASEILGLRLNADWVVLSACNTAGSQGAGAEAVSGLGRAFFHAGARALLVSNWPVETTSARALTTALFRSQAADATLSRAEAARRAMLGLIDGPGLVEAATGRTVFSYAHPIFWAPFSIVGDGGVDTRPAPAP